MVLTTTSPVSATNVWVSPIDFAQCVAVAANCPLSPISVADLASRWTATPEKSKGLAQKFGFKVGYDINLYKSVEFFDSATT
jgi:hypothetical protein